MDLIELADEMSCSARPDRGSFRRPPTDRASKIAQTDLPDERPLTEGRAAGTADEPRTRTLAAGSHRDAHLLDEDTRRCYCCRSQTRWG